MTNSSVRPARPFRSRTAHLQGDFVTGALLIVIPTVFTLAFALLGSNFEYPDILRKPIAHVLERFQAGGANLVMLWYVMLVAAMSFIAIPTLTRRLFPKPSVWLDLGVSFGVVAGLVQALGFARWVFLVPALAATYTDPTSSDATRAASGVIFEAFNRYAGMGIGEHLGYLFTALWTLTIAAGLRQSSRWLSVSGAVFAIGILVGLLEPAGVAGAGTINALAYLLWSVWMIALGVTVTRAPRARAD
jgi:Domain of unknown function (DUF4386)